MWALWDLDPPIIYSRYFFYFQAEKQRAHRALETRRTTDPDYSHY